MIANSKRIFYDDACPMCRVYTAAFVRCGILSADGRKGFSKAAPADLDRIDRKRARHEIPLIDTNGGETLYGMDAWFALLASRFPFLQPLFRSGVPKAVLTPLYAMISYNRRVIVGCPPSAIGTNGFDPAPDFSFVWRTTYLVLCLVGWLLLLRGVASGVPSLAPGVYACATLQIIGITLALTVLPRHCGVWDRAGSLATNGLTFALLLAGLGSLGGGSTVVLWCAFAVSGLVTLVDANRRLRPRCAKRIASKPGRITLPMVEVAEGNTTVLRCFRCGKK